MKITLTNGIKRNVGSVSWGTLRNEDIIPSLLDECESCGVGVQEMYRSEWSILRPYTQFETLSASTQASLEESMNYLSDKLFSELNAIAPDYAYFGSTDGDGSDFGWWYAEVTEDSEGNTIVNPDDISHYGYDSRYEVSFDAMGSTFVAFADNESDALDYVLDFCEEKEYNGYLLNADEESEALADRVSVGYGGNHGIAYNADNLTIRKAA